MTLLEIAQVYTDLVSADGEIPEQECRAKDIVGALRTKYHNLLMDQMQAEGVEYVDRVDAARIAFEIVNKEGVHTR